MSAVVTCDLTCDLQTPPAVDGPDGREYQHGMKLRTAKFGIGQVVRHRKFSFRGVIFDIDPEFSNTEEWWLSIPEATRPGKDQPYYHLYAENAETEYVAYVSEQNLLPDECGEPVRHPDVEAHFVRNGDGAYQMKQGRPN